MRTIIIRFAIIILIIVIGYFMFRKVEEPETSSIIIPNIVYNDSRMDIKPSLDFIVEEYRIEYAALYTDVELSQLVSFTILWSNKGGFDNVDKIKVERFVGDSKSAVQTIPISRYNSDSTISQENAKYFTNFQDNLSVDFEGADVTSSVIGSNTFKITYMLKKDNPTDDDNYLSMNTTNELQPQNVSREDIMLAVETDKFKSVIFSPRIDVLSGGDITRIFTNDEGYYFIPKQVKSPPEYSVNSLIYGEIGRPIYIIIGTTTGGGVRLMRDDNEYISVNTDGSVITVTDISNAEEFQIISNDNDSIIFGNFKADGSTINKVLVVELENQSNRLKYINFDDIDDEDVYNSMFMTYGNEGISKVSCAFADHQVVGDCADTRTQFGLSGKRGKKITRVSINNNPLGDNKCAVNVDGTTFNLMEHANNPNIAKFNDKTYFVKTNCDIECDYEINKSSAGTACAAKSCYKNDSEKFLDQGQAFTTLQGWNADGTQKVCGGTPQQINCSTGGQGFEPITRCETCEPEIDSSYCDRSTTSSPQQRQVRTWKKQTNQPKCFDTTQDDVTTWNSDKRYETDLACSPSCKVPNWEPRTSCDGTTKNTTYTNTATLDYTGQPYCSGPSYNSPANIPTAGGCGSCSSFSRSKSSGIEVTQAEIKACDDLNGCTASLSCSGKTCPGSNAVDNNLTCKGGYYIR